MEVHKHPHHVMHSKKWHEYLLEFFMLFLAVFLGFIAENIRENLSDQEKERQYMQSIVKDLKTDDANITSILKRKTEDIFRADSLLRISDNELYKKESGSAYNLSRVLSITSFFHITNGTIQQLINSGGLRLVKKRKIIDSIQSYINKYEDLSVTQNLEEQIIIDYRNSVSKVFDVKVYNQMVSDPVNSDSISVVRADIDLSDIHPIVGNPTLLSMDKFSINELLMKVHYMKRNKVHNRAVLSTLKSKAQNLIAIIEKDYHLQNE